MIITSKRAGKGKEEQTIKENPEKRRGDREMYYCHRAF
jgi:hypothetical protein